MKLYHGSPHKLDFIKKKQATAGEGIDVPEDELLNAIYLTPNYEFALAIASMPDGVAEIDNRNKKIEFEKPELFDPNKEVYIYEIDSEDIPSNNIKKVDEVQIAVIGDIKGITPKISHIHKARDIEQYYKINKINEIIKPSELNFR